MDEMSKIINQVTWMLQAVRDQIRFINADVKIANKNAIFHSNPYFVTYTKHIGLTLTLLTQAQKSYLSLVRTGRINKLSLNKIYSTYYQRAIYNEQIASHNLSQYNYKNDPSIAQLYMIIYNKTYKLETMMNQLTASYKKLINLSR